MTLNTEIRRIRLADARPQKVNARYMPRDVLDRLVENVRKDGVLTSVPLVYLNPDDGGLDILSGHHRIKAAIMALGADVEANVQVILDAQSLAELRARQMSHNAIEGEDDYAVLKQMWEEIDDIDWRAYAGLDDKTLDLLEHVDLSSLGEANLDMLTVQLLFLPHEVARARDLFERAEKMFATDARWIAYEEEWTKLVDALESVRGSYDVKNTAAAFGLILDVFEQNLGDLDEGWWNAVDQAPKHDKWVPLEAVFGTRSIPAQAAGVVKQALDRMHRSGDVGPDTADWQVLEFLAAEYLAGPVSE